MNVTWSYNRTNADGTTLNATAARFVVPLNQFGVATFDVLMPLDAKHVGNVRARARVCMRCACG
jgi:hypothetical protein